jgi:hypothetical protein
MPGQSVVCRRCGHHFEITSVVQRVQSLDYDHSLCVCCNRAVDFDPKDDDRAIREYL